MTSYELLDFYEEILNKMGELDGYTEELSKLVKMVTPYQDKLLNTVYPDTFNWNNANIQNELNTQRNAVIESIKNFSMNFNILDNHENLVRVRDEIKAIFDKYPIVLEDEKNKIINLFIEYDKVTKTIYQYVRTRNNSIIVELFIKINFIVNEYNKFVNSYQSIKCFMEKTENKITETENEKIIKLHFYDEHLNPEYFSMSIEAIKESYEIICMIRNVSPTEVPLKVVKIESGSWFTKFLGLDPVIEYLSFLIKKITELLFNKFTFEGNVLRHKQILDLLSKDAEVRLKYKELGYDIDFDEEEIVKYHYMAVKSIGKLVGKTTKMKINEKEIYLEGHLKQKYLSESSVLLIDEGKTDEDKTDEDSKKNNNDEN
jgi:hypothetical protein